MSTTSALTDLRGALDDVDLPFTLERADAARKTRRELLDQLDDYKSLLPNHTVRVVPNWDHFPMIEDPATFMLETLQLANQLTHQFS